MKKVILFVLLFYTFRIGLFAQTITNIIIPSDDIYRHNGTLQANGKNIYNLTVSGKTKVTAFAGYFPNNRGIPTIVTITDNTGKMILPEEGRIHKIIDAGTYNIEVIGADGYENKSGTYELEVHTNEIISVEGTNLIQKLIWLFKNIKSNSLYIIELTANESISPQTLLFPEKMNVEIKIVGVGGEKSISLSENGTLFTVGNRVELCLGNNVTLKGRNGNNNPLVNVEGGLVMENGSKIIGNAGGGVGVSGSFQMYGGEISGNTGIGVLVYNRISSRTGYNGSFLMFDGVISGNSGRGVNSGGDFLMFGGKINNNGGGVSTSGTFTMYNGEINGNTATEGGGIYSTIAFTMYDGIISGNTATLRGGGVYVNDTFTMEGGEISGNKASERSGGGVFVAESNDYTINKTFTMKGGTISGNTAATAGGGISINGSTFIMENGVISRNTAPMGAGVYLVVAYYNPFITKTGGIIFGFTQGDINSNMATAGNNNGHAVYIDPSYTLGSINRRESTANPNDILNSSVNGVAGGWGF